LFTYMPAINGREPTLEIHIHLGGLGRPAEFSSIVPRAHPNNRSSYLTER
jgi:hypothetical protein